MKGMNDDVREAVRIELARRKWRQNDLAAHTQLSKQHISQLMTGKTRDVPDAWSRIFKTLGLKVIVVKDDSPTAEPGAER